MTSERAGAGVLDVGRVDALADVLASPLAWASAHNAGGCASTCTDVNALTRSLARSAGTGVREFAGIGAGADAGTWAFVGASAGGRG